MRQWQVLFNKEMVEMARNFKWIWVPIVFILIAVKEPLTLYYLPQILDSLGGLPDGAIIQLPVPSASEVLISILSQINTLGVLIIVLASMGIIAAERKSGVAGLILVKPVSYSAYITAKWAGAMLLLWISFFLAYVFSWYYVVILFEAVPFTDFILSFILNGIWLSFVLTLTIFFNALYKSPGAVGFVTLLTVIFVSLITNLFAKWLEWSPAQLPAYTSQFLFSGVFSTEAIISMILAIVAIVVLLAGSVQIFMRKELA
ncbi:ABC transporter permease [Bacillus sp. S/N-304-OC-R1]|uniref:ABC transporter permease n=1 Tax=Bacillus sp. S/N-304-OC-R1 TaxID=2758034 RepID=UPI001C8E690A|nr:ABC transporter permease [Bacillus sp. S/N-304-OC-R1]MBY0124523.1 ABC transporter permease [Bacillus sp. S/N-304-OC-R1]